MAGFLGLAAGAGLGYVGQKHQERMQEERQYKQLQQKTLMELPHTDPSKAFDDNYWKQVVKSGISQEHADMIKAYVQPQAAAALREQKKQDDLMKMIGGAVMGGAMPTASPTGPAPSAPAAASGTPAQGPAPAPQAPSGMEALDTEAKSLDQAELAISQLKGASPETIKSYQNVIASHRKDIDEKRKALQAPITEAQKKQAVIDTEHKNAPTIRADAAAKSGAMAGAGESARKAAENSSAAIAGDVKRQVALEEAKKQLAATDKPWTASDGAKLRSTISASVVREMTPASTVGKLFSGPSVKEKQTEVDRRMLALGVLPDGRKMSDVGAKLGTHQGRDGYYIPNPDGKTAKFYAIGS